MNAQGRDIVERILAADQITQSELRKLELASGIQLASRISPIPGATGGVLLFSAADVRKLIEAGMIPQTR